MLCDFKNPMGPFSYGGTIVSNGDVGLDGRTEENAVNYLGNNHGGLLVKDDELYVFITGILTVLSIADKAVQKKEF